MSTLTDLLQCCLQLAEEIPQPDIQTTGLRHELYALRAECHALKHQYQQLVERQISLENQVMELSRFPLMSMGKGNKIIVLAEFMEPGKHPGGGHHAPA